MIHVNPFKSLICLKQIKRYTARLGSIPLPIGNTLLGVMRLLEQESRMQVENVSIESEVGEESEESEQHTIMLLYFACYKSL